MSLSALYTDHISLLQQGYEKALEHTKYDAVVLHAGRGLKQRSVDDQYWPLKVNPSFAHWLPLLEENAMVVIEPGKTPTLLRPKNNSFWEGPAPVPGDHFWQAFRVVEGDVTSFVDACPKGRVAFIGDTLEAAEPLGIGQDNINPPSLLSDLDTLRSIKSAYEIECMTQATRIATEGHRALDSEFHQGNHSEFGLHLDYLRVTGQDSTQTPYGNIVAQGSNAAILHHVHYSRNIDSTADQSLLVDAGANYMGYASDITRTTVRGDGQAASDFRALIAGLDAMQVQLCADAKPGRPYQELHVASHRRLADLLLQSGLCNGSPEALVDQGVTRAFFPHGLGHSLGLQVHDVGCRLVPPANENPFLRNTSTITEGQVFTIEPGCYFIDGLLGPLKESPAGSLVSWPTVLALQPFGGIRIEDNLAVGATSSTNLTRDNWSTQQ